MRILPQFFYINKKKQQKGIEREGRLIFLLGWIKNDFSLSRKRPEQCKEATHANLGGGGKFQKKGKVEKLWRETHACSQRAQKRMANVVE
jgi:hypothetical protein